VYKYRVSVDLSVLQDGYHTLGFLVGYLTALALRLCNVE
jgi:hypothetical protein